MNHLRYRRQDETWPATKNAQFWSSAATFIANGTHSNTVRTGMEFSMCVKVYACLCLQEVDAEIKF